MSQGKSIGVVGVGWVGLVTSACFAELGHSVVARDIIPEKVEALSRGEVTIHEPRIDELLARNSERLTFTTSMEELLERSKLIFVCVDTPPTASGDADLSRVRAVVDSLPADSDHVLVMKSTVPAGTGAAIRRDRPGLAYVSCPEFLKEGSAVEDFLNPDRVVIGADPGDEAAADAVEALYEPLGGEIVRTDVASAEMIKLGSNAFLATKISFINEIANVCEEVGADVTEVARGMGLDERIGPSFLRAGIGYGGSCFPGEETVLVRYRGFPRLVSFSELWEMVAEDEAVVDGQALSPQDLWAWSWVPGEAKAEWMPVTVLTQRLHDGEFVEVQTKSGRRVTVTADHPFVVGDGIDDEVLTRVLAHELSVNDWLPLATGSADAVIPKHLALAGVVEDHFTADEVIVRPMFASIDNLASLPIEERRAALGDRPDHSQRLGDIKRTGAMRLGELAMSQGSLVGSELGTARSGTYVPAEIEIDHRFWRIVGLYLAEGCVIRDRGRNGATRERIRWYFHPTREEHLVDEIVSYWLSQGVKARTFTTPTCRGVEISSRILAAWWTEFLNLGRNSYEQHLPDLIWEQPEGAKQALLSGLWEGNGSWSLINGGPSVILEVGTVSDRLAEGVARLLGDLDLVCSWRRGRTNKSTKVTHWLRVSGADQVERAMFLVPERDRPGVLTAIGRQSKRIAPTGYRRFSKVGIPWVRVTDLRRFRSQETVYSMEVQGSHTIAAAGGLVVSNCFPKDVEVLKQLAGNSGYHFQLLTSVIEVNELQKRRVIGKLRKHLGTLVGKRVALLGVAFKPHTDDMRQASSLVLAARLEGEGAIVTAYDPVAMKAAEPLMPEVEMAQSAADALKDADAAVLVTEWPQFAELDWQLMAKKMAQPLIIDGRNYLDPAELAAAGFVYEGIGRLAEPAPQLPGVGAAGDPSNT